MCHVLIIEDEMVAAYDIQGVLRLAGATSFAFADTEHGAVREARARPPAVIISDFMLSDGSGPQAVGAIRAELGAIPTIFVTALPDYVEAEDGVLVMEKPFDPRRLAEVFRAVAPA